MNLKSRVYDHPDFKDKYDNNPDALNRELAFQKIFDEVLVQDRKNELDLYRMLAKDDAFKRALQHTIKQALNLPAGGLLGAAPRPQP